MLHVAMATVVSVLDAKTDYPTENMELVLAAYLLARNKHLVDLGYSAAQITGFTEAAADALTAWLETRADDRSAAGRDFDAWARQLMHDE